MNLQKAFEECLVTKYIPVKSGGDYAVKREGDTVKIFFEWSNGREDWINNFKFFAIPWKPYKDMAHTWLCHRGFLKVWKGIEPYLLEYIEDPDVKRIEIVGYSHGAAVALLCYEYCRFNRPYIEVEGVGFGCPRVFWGYIPKSVKERFKDFKVVWNGNDIVCHVPPALFGFRHISEVVKIGQTNPVKDHFDTAYLSHLKELN